MDTEGNSRLRDQSTHLLDQFKARVKRNCRDHLKNLRSDAWRDLKDLRKSLKDSFQPTKAEHEAQQKRERDIREFLNSDKRNPRDHTFSVFHPEPRMLVG